MCECMNEEGARCVMVPFYNGTSRQEARKRGGKKNAKEEMDLNKMKTLFLQLKSARDASALSEEETALLKTRVEMLLKQYSNVTTTIAEKKKQKESFLKGFIGKVRRGSDVVEYPFSVAGIRFSATDPMLEDLSFTNYAELQEYIMEATIEKTEKMDEEEAVSAPLALYKKAVTLVCFSYEVACELCMKQDRLFLKAESIKPVGGEWAFHSPMTRRAPSKPLPHFAQIQDLLLHNREVLLADVVSVLPRNHLLGNKALELFFGSGDSWYLDFASLEDRKEFFGLLSHAVQPALQKYYRLFSFTLELSSSAGSRRPRSCSASSRSRSSGSATASPPSTTSSASTSSAVAPTRASVSTPCSRGSSLTTPPPPST